MIRFLSLVVILIFSPTLAAVNLERLSFDELAKRSDLVLIGKAYKFEGAGVVRFAVVNVTTSLKGAENIKSVRVAIRSGFAEADPDCCEKSKPYLFFLQKNPDGSYSSANGPFGIVAIK
jgi:hypothetical protein